VGIAGDAVVGEIVFHLVGSAGGDDGSFCGINQQRCIASDELAIFSVPEGEEEVVVSLDGPHFELGGEIMLFEPFGGHGFGGLFVHGDIEFIKRSCEPKSARYSANQLSAVTSLPFVKFFCRAHE